ncbi:MAG: hypothetical protein ABL993_12975 [Vicinamibacterales bacterium]
MTTRPPRVAARTADARPRGLPDASITTSASAAAIGVAIALAADRFLAPQSPASFGVWLVAGLVALACVARMSVPLRRVITDSQIARHIEERCPELEDALISAVAARNGSSPRAVVAAVVGDAARRTRGLDLDRVVSRSDLRAASMRALAATLALVIACGAAVSPARRASRAFALFMTAAGVASRDHAVAVARPPRVERIDLRYEYPPAFRMDARVEEDGGDIYGPPGTRVHLLVHTDTPVTSGALMVTPGNRVTLAARRAAPTADTAPGDGTVLEGDLTISEDGSYRVALSDEDGLSSPGETEYFIRTFEDRPPNVRVLRPTGDRRVTPVEEVSIEASADDDVGVAAFDLVFAVKGGEEQVVPFTRDGSGLSVVGHRTIKLADLRLQLGDFVSYYARARGVGRGKRSSEARSDIYFLEVSPFKEEFVPPEGQRAGGEDRALDDLVESQREIVTATWRLDRGGRDAGTRSREDVRTVARAQADLRVKTLAQAAQREQPIDATSRGNGGRPPGGVLPQETTDDAMAKAAEAMLGAQQQLDALKTAPALPLEMAALDELMRARSDARRRAIEQQQDGQGDGPAGSRQPQDLSATFDRELARQQQTNFETLKATSESRDGDAPAETLDRIRELAKRQEALNREGQELAREGHAGEELRRELDRLAREQSELRQQAETLARQLQQAQSSQAGGRGRQGGQDGQQGQQHGRAMQEISEEMRAAASELRRQDASQAGERGDRAAERLRELEQSMRSSRLDDELSRVRELRDRLAELDRRLSEMAQQGGRSGGEGRGQQDGGNGQGSADRSPGDGPWDGTRRLLEDLRGDKSLGLSPGQLNGFNPGSSAPGTEGFKQDFARWDELKEQLVAVLERVESSAAARLRGQEATDRLNTGVTQSVPEQYRRLVDRYYRALAGTAQGK